VRRRIEAITRAFIRRLTGAVERPDTAQRKALQSP
jgi:hypothetical protein